MKLMAAGGVYFPTPLVPRCTRRDSSGYLKILHKQEVCSPNPVNELLTFSRILALLSQGSTG
jgi:hypothetical protein